MTHKVLDTDLDPQSGIIVVFWARRSDRIKVLLWVGSGLLLACKRLEQGKFACPLNYPAEKAK